VRPLGTKGADAPEELVENVCIQNKRAASAWSLLHVSCQLDRVALAEPVDDV